MAFTRTRAVERCEVNRHVPLPDALIAAYDHRPDVFYGLPLEVQARAWRDLVLYIEDRERDERAEVCGDE